jgi:hypothetical protein
MIQLRNPHMTVASPENLKPPHQPGSGLQLGARRRVGCPDPVELLYLAELALPRRAEPAKGDFLHPVCDGSQQQLAAEVSGRLNFVETTPLLTQFADVESGEARERLPASRSVLDPAVHARSETAMR